MPSSWHTPAAVSVAAATGAIATGNANNNPILSFALCTQALGFELWQSRAQVFI